MSETENLLKIQEFIDDHKDDLTEGDYLIMVNSLMKTWKNASDQERKRKKMENELIQTIYDINFNYQCEKRLHDETKTLYLIQCGKNQEQQKEMENLEIFNHETKTLYLIQCERNQDQQKEIEKLKEVNSLYITIYIVLIIAVSYIIL
jgi:hypothetical protein